MITVAVSRYFFDFLVHPVNGRWRPVCALGLIVALALLGPLAHASPPDPSWVPGIYDAADYDDVVVLVGFGTEGVSLVNGADLQPILQVIEDPFPFPKRAVNNLSEAVVPPRGPPSS